NYAPVASSKLKHPDWPCRIGGRGLQRLTSAKARIQNAFRSSYPLSTERHRRVLSETRHTARSFDAAARMTQMPGPDHRRVWCWNSDRALCHLLRSIRGLGLVRRPADLLAKQSTQKS